MCSSRIPSRKESDGMIVTFVRFIHVLNDKEVVGTFCFPVEREETVFSERQLLEVLKLNDYNVIRIIHTDGKESVH